MLRVVRALSNSPREWPDAMPSVQVGGAPRCHYTVLGVTKRWQDMLNPLNRNAVSCAWSSQRLQDKRLTVSGRKGARVLGRGRSVLQAQRLGTPAAMRVDVRQGDAAAPPSVRNRRGLLGHIGGSRRRGRGRETVGPANCRAPLRESGCARLPKHEPPAVWWCAIRCAPGPGSAP